MFVTHNAKGKGVMKKNIILNTLRYIFLACLCVMGFITIVASGGGGGDDDDSHSPWITIDSPSADTVITYHKNIRLVGSAWSNPNASCSDGPGVTVHYENETTGDSGYAQQFWDCSLCPTLRRCPTNHTWSAEVAIEETTNHIKVMALSAGGPASDQITVVYSANLPPTTPTNLVANAISRFQIDLSWGASTDDYGLTGYNIYRDGVYLKSVPGTSASDTGLTPDTDCCYTVSAYDLETIESAPSNQACATSLPDLPPSTPANLVANAATSFQIDLSWEASSDDWGVVGYKLYRDGIYIKDVTSTSTSDVGLTPNTEYCYTVSAYDEFNHSNQSSQACATSLPDLPPSTPANLVANAFTSFQIDLSWEASSDDNGVIGYNIYRDGIYLTSVPGTSTSDTGLTQNTTYCYAVSAYDISGNESNMSNQVCFKTWTFITLGSGNYPSISADSGNHAHISFYDGNNHNIKYATNVSGAWETETIDTGYLSYSSSTIAIDSTDYVHICYFDDSNNSLKYATNASGNWVIGTIDDQGELRYYNSIAIDSADNVHISYYDSSRELKYATNASGTWVKELLVWGFRGVRNSIAIDSVDNVHISYNSTLMGDDIYYITNASGAWVEERVEGASGDQGWSSIVIDSSDNVRIAYVDYTHDSLKLAKNDSGVWDIETIDTGIIKRDSTSIAVDSGDNIYISYNEGYNHNFTTNKSGVWEIYTVYSDDNHPGSSSIIIDSADNFHMAIVPDRYNPTITYITNQ
jgi:chitodextrinase